MILILKRKNKLNTILGNNSYMPSKKITVFKKNSDFRLKTKSTAYAVDFSIQKCHKPSIYLGLRHFLCYNRSIKVGDGDRTYDDFEYRKKT